MLFQYVYTVLIPRYTFMAGPQKSAQARKHIVLNVCYCLNFSIMVIRCLNSLHYSKIKIFSFSYRVLICCPKCIYSQSNLFML